MCLVHIGIDMVQPLKFALGNQSMILKCLRGHGPDFDVSNGQSKSIPCVLKNARQSCGSAESFSLQMSDNLCSKHAVAKQLSNASPTMVTCAYSKETSDKWQHVESRFEQPWSIRLSISFYYFSACLATCVGAHLHVPILVRISYILYKNQRDSKSLQALLVETRMSLWSHIAAAQPFEPRSPTESASTL